MFYEFDCRGRDSLRIAVECFASYEEEIYQPPQVELNAKVNKIQTIGDKTLSMDGDASPTREPFHQCDQTVTSRDQAALQINPRKFKRFFII